MKTAFVTGGTGFLGLNLVEELIASGWKVVALHRPTSNLRWLGRPGVTLAVGDVTDRASLERAIPEGCDAVFHVAANTGLWAQQNAAQTRDNVDGTRNVVQTALARGAKRFVHTSSVAAWGTQRVVPFDETAPHNAEHSNINYERTKWLAEVEVEQGIRSGLSAVIVNPGHIVGKYDTHNWARMIKLIWTRSLPGIPPGGGSYGHAREIARAHVAAANTGGVGERYLLGGTDATNFDAVQILGRIMDRPVPRFVMPRAVLAAAARVSDWASIVTRRAPTLTPEVVHIASKRSYVRSDKACRELGFQIKPLEPLLRESFEWLRDEGLLDS